MWRYYYHLPILCLNLATVTYQCEQKPNNNYNNNPNTLTTALTTTLVTTLTTTLTTLTTALTTTLTTTLTKTLTKTLTTTLTHPGRAARRADQYSQSHPGGAYSEGSHC